MTRGFYLALLVVILFITNYTIGASNECGNCVHGSCIDGSCVCKAGFYGADCSNGTGICIEGTQEGCVHGTCKGGVCICKPGFYGDRCENKGCLNNCNYKGLCFEAADEPPRCICMAGHFGPDCSQSGCSKGCKHGTCVMTKDNTIKCECESGWAGEDCSMKVCNRCIHGVCKGTECVCESGWSGADCSKRSCPDCGPRGTCDHNTGQCICKTPYFNRPGGLEDCSGNQKVCINKCTSFAHGICLHDGCHCRPGWTGADCSEKRCINDCTGNGICSNGECLCNNGFTGKDCSIKTCPNNCNNHGLCVDGQCHCLKPYSEFALKKFPNISPNITTSINTTQAIANGVKLEQNKNKQFTIIPYTSINAKLSSKVKEHFYAPVPLDTIPSGFTANDCSNVQCITDCGAKNGQGTCDTRIGVCMCNEGWYSKIPGHDCNAKICSNNCNNNGLCIDDKCQCIEGYTGTSCEIKLNSIKNPQQKQTFMEIEASHATSNQLTAKAYETAYINEAHEYLLEVIKKSDDIIIEKAAQAVVSDALQSQHLDNEHDAAIAAAFIDEFGSKSSAYVHILATPEGEAAARLALDSIGHDINGPLPPSKKQLQQRVKYIQEQYEKEHKHIKFVEELNKNYTSNTGRGCLGNCSYRGICVDGQCKCHNSYGALCEHLSCPLGCSGHGKCDPATGKCTCDNGYGGAACNEPTCNPSNCNNHGTCQLFNVTNKYNVVLATRPKCVCKDGYTGPDCNTKTCTSKTCSNRGTCVNDTCYCANGFRGENCEIGPICNRDCGPNGKCEAAYDSVTGSITVACVCNDGFTGPYCQDKLCSKEHDNKCGTHGICINDKCVCEAGWSGETCNVREGCGECDSVGGKCDENSFGQPTCKCNPGYGGPACKQKTCSIDCNGRGECLDGKCQCTNGWTGPNCTQGCPNDCNLRGECIMDALTKAPRCDCKGKFYGAACQYGKCPGTIAGALGQVISCNGNGTCDKANGTCQCSVGFSQTEDCSSFSYDQCLDDCKSYCRNGQRGAFPIKDLFTGEIVVSTSAQCLDKCADKCVQERDRLGL